jgi:glycosyltransferase involved in cell wall biosynthesis
LYNNKKIAVVVPAFNEEVLIRPTLETIPAYVDVVYAIDDGSTDNTYTVMKEIASRDSRIHIIQHNPNEGVGAAIVTGYKKCVEDEIDVAVIMAGDNQMDPKYIPDLLKPIITGTADYTKGNRLVNNEYSKGMSKWRLFGNKILTFFTRLSSGYWDMSDPQNGYSAISFHALSSIRLDDIYPWYGYCNDLLAKLNVHGFVLVDVPIPARYGDEISKIKYGPYIVRVSGLLFRNFLWRQKMKNSMNKDVIRFDDKITYK